MKIRYLFLCLLVLLVTGGGLLQTHYFQGKLVRWAEKRSGGALQIGKIEGLLPFWAELDEVRYHTEDTDIVLDHVQATFSPLSLLFGRIGISHLSISHVHISSNTQQRQWPSFPLPIYIQSFTIEHLTTAEIEDTPVSGVALLRDNFYLRLSLSPFHITLEGDKKKGTIALIGNLKHKDQLWMEGVYSWESKELTGHLYGLGDMWKGSADFTFIEKQTLSLSSFDLLIDKFPNLKGELNYDFNEHHLTATGLFLDHPFSLLTTLNISSTAIEASPFSLHLGEETLVGNLCYALQERSLMGELDLKMNDFALIPTECPIEGFAQAHLTFAGTQLSVNLQASNIIWKDLLIPQVNFEAASQNNSINFILDLPNASLLAPAYEVFPAVHLLVKGHATTEKISLEGKIEGLGEKPFSLLCELPILLSPSLMIDKEAPFSLCMQGSGSIDPVLAFLENASLIARGAIDLNLSVSGTWKDPLLEGHLIYHNGRIESLTTGSLFQDIYMEMKGEGKDLKITSFNAHDVDQGELSGEGHIAWDLENHFPFSLQLSAYQYMVLALDPFTATMNAEMLLTGSLEGVLIEGRATLVEGRLAIPAKMPVHVPCVDVCYLRPCPEQNLKPRRIIPVYLDVVVEAPRSLTIEGRGLDSEWGGTFHIKGEHNDLSYTGKLKLVRGRFMIINRTFDLVEGRIRIDGLDPRDIFINLKGDYELTSLTASVLITGTLDNTHLSFCSNPPLSTNQILSWILFYQDINELTPFQACRLASILVSLSGKYSGPKTFDKIKSGLGIDVFSITDCDIDSADLTFQVGKYLSEGTFVGINKSISGNFDSVMIQTRLIRDFYLEADYGGSLNGLTPNGGKFIFKWYKSY